jgi:hypothetical protein
MSAAVADPTTQTPPVTPSTTEPTPPETPPGNQTGGDARFTQDQVNALLAEERRKAKDRADADRAKAEQAAKDAALADQQKFKELADERAARIGDLESQLTQVETLTTERDAALAVVADLVKDELKDAPKHVVALLEGKSPVEQLRYVQEYRDEWRTQPLRGIPSNGNGRGSEALTTEQQRAASEQTARRLKNVF